MKCWDCAEDGLDTQADLGYSDDNGPLCQGCYYRRLDDGLIEPSDGAPQEQWQVTTPPEVYTTDATLED